MRCRTTEALGEDLQHASEREQRPAASPRTRPPSLPRNDIYCVGARLQYLDHLLLQGLNTASIFKDAPIDLDRQSSVLIVDKVEAFDWIAWSTAFALRFGDRRCLHGFVSRWTGAFVGHAPNMSLRG
jgi:hypothetical protein